MDELKTYVFELISDDRVMVIVKAYRVDEAVSKLEQYVCNADDFKLTSQ